MPARHSIWIGYDPREASAFAVARSSLRHHLTQPIPIRGVVLSALRDCGLYTRPTEIRRSAVDRPILWDTISDAPMATEFAVSRFLVPHLAGSGLALFMDCDMLVRVNVARLLGSLDRSKAVHCVKHRHQPPAGTKMDGQTQTFYARKNWSSFIVFDCDHPANRKLTVEMVNTLPGRDLHALYWLNDADIGELGPEWNWLVGHSPADVEPAVVHFTDGGPWFAGYEDVPFADEWRAELVRWAA